MSISVSVVIPSYRRPESLKRCLQALDKQFRFPDEVIVVCRVDDRKSIALVRQWKKRDHLYQPCLALVDLPGQIAALRRGVKMASGDVVVFTDDDTIPHSDWIERLVCYYSDPMIGGVGGRDLINGMVPDSLASRVGVITWYGKMMGNHHIGCNKASEVDVLKGANASFRRHLITLPTFFKGEGAEVHNEVFMCLSVRQRGYKLIYDPDICVDHFPAVRFDADQRDESNPIAIRNAAFNVSVTSILLAPRRKQIAMFLFNVLVGQRGAPGIVRLLVGVCRAERDVLFSFVPAQLGQIAGIMYYIRTKSVLKQPKLQNCSLKETNI